MTFPQNGDDMVVGDEKDKGQVPIIFCSVFGIFWERSLNLGRVGRIAGRKNTIDRAVCATHRLLIDVGLLVRPPQRYFCDTAFIVPSLINSTHSSVTSTYFLRTYGVACYVAWLEILLIDEKSRHLHPIESYRKSSSFRIQFYAFSFYPSRR